MESTQYKQENIVSIFIPMTIKKRVGVATIILPKNVPQQPDKPNYDQTLINAFAEAYKWQQSLNNGSMSVNQLMEREI